MSDHEKKHERAAYMRSYWKRIQEEDPERYRAMLDRRNAKAKERRTTDPEHTEKLNAYHRAYQKKRRAVDPEFVARKRAATRKSYNKSKAEDPTAARDRWHDWALRSNYGITRVEYDRMLAEQGSGCAICGGQSKKGRRLSVDHDHGHCPGKRGCTECFRGLLCDSCNGGLGLFNDNTDLLASAAAYIRAHRRKRLRLVSNQ